jgi:hypothetical protein
VFFPCRKCIAEYSSTNTPRAINQVLIAAWPLDLFARCAPNTRGLDAQNLAKKVPSPSQYSYRIRIAKSVLAWWYRDDLNRLALLFGTDKWGSHWYTPHYERYFQPLKHKSLNMLEIGVGGYENTDKGAGSLRMWKAYFRKNRIVGIDICDKTHFSEHRIDIRQCDQTDSEALLRLSNEYGGFDIIVDDGSHLNEHVIKTFHLLFPLLRQNGIYVVEDTQTAYWPTWGRNWQPEQLIGIFHETPSILSKVTSPTTSTKTSSRLLSSTTWFSFGKETTTKRRIPRSSFRES